MEGDIGISGEAAASFAKGKVGFSALKDTKAGTFGASADANGDFLTAELSGLAKLGRFRMRLNGEDVALNGLGVMLNAQAAVASGSVSGGVTLFGVKVGFTLSGMVGGIGATAGAYLTTSRVGWCLGATAGMGGNVSLDLDFSYWSNKLKNLIVSKIRKK